MSDAMLHRERMRNAGCYPAPTTACGIAAEARARGQLPTPARDPSFMSQFEVCPSFAASTCPTGASMYPTYCAGNMECFIGRDDKWPKPLEEKKKKEKKEKEKKEKKKNKKKRNRKSSSSEDSSKDSNDEELDSEDELDNLFRKKKLGGYWSRKGNPDKDSLATRLVERIEKYKKQHKQ